MSSAAEDYKARWANPVRTSLYTIGVVAIVLGAIVVISALNGTNPATAYFTGVVGGAIAGLGVQLVIVAALLHGIGIALENHALAVTELQPDN